MTEIADHSTGLARLRGRLAMALGLPILRRELQADFRKSRFLVTHTLCLCILGAVLLILVATKVEDQRTTPTAIGQSLFNIFFVVQYLVILLVFPAFSSTSFADERSRHTLDLLLTSTLKPRQLVWGKFLAATVYCLLYVVASIPLMAISFLFGGVTLAEVIVAYSFLILLTLLVSMFGVCVSSCVSSSLRSTLWVYIAVAAVIALSWGWSDDEFTVRGFMDSMGWGTSQFGSSVSLGGASLIATFGYLFLTATNRVRPLSDNRATALRLLSFLVVLVFSWFGAWYSWSAGQDPYAALLFSGAALGLAAWVFPTEEAAISRRNRRDFARVSGVFYPARIFAPGAFWGLTYVVVLTTIVVSGLAAGRALNVGADELGIVQGLRQSLLALPFFVLTIASLGFLLAALDFSPLYARLTVFFLGIIVTLLPVILAHGEQTDAVWTGYYLSPVTLWWSLHPPYDESGITYTLFGSPNIVVARYVYGTLAVLFAAVGVWCCRRGGHPMLTLSDQ